MTIGVNGIGWISSTGYGMTLSRRTTHFAPGETLARVAREQLFRQPVKNFGRLDLVSRITLTAVSLALQDGGIAASPLEKQPIGIVGTNNEGSLATDLDYYRDYVDNGRKLSRANLFIYTLPSSPLGEAAIHFGLTGPLLFTMDRERSARSALTTASDLLDDGSVPAMLAGRTEADQGIYLLLGPEGERSLCTVSEAAEVLSGPFEVAVLAERFALMAT
jgi:3-oxoacyl-[acyl-carrier-protein] synthase II